MADETLMDGVLEATSARWTKLTFWRRFKPDWRRAAVNYRARKEQRHYLYVSEPLEK